MGTLECVNAHLSVALSDLFCWWVYLFDLSYSIKFLKTSVNVQGVLLFCRKMNNCARFVQ